MPELSELNGSDAVGNAARPADALVASARAAIRDAVLEGKLHPGEVVRPEVVGSWVGVPAVTVLDALDLLVHEQLLEIHSQGESRVIDRSSAAIDEILHTVGVLMGGVVRLHSSADDRGGEHLAGPLS